MVEVIMPVVKDGIQEPIRPVVRGFPGIRKGEQLRPWFHFHVEMPVEEAAPKQIVVTIKVVAPDEPVCRSLCLPNVICSDKADYQRPGDTIFTRQFCQISVRAEFDRLMGRSGASLP